MKALRFTLLSFVVALIAIVPGVARSTVEDANRVLGFEAVSDWSINNGTIVGTTSVRTQGSASLAVSAAGYTVLTSRLLGPIGAVQPQLSYDLWLPTSQPNPNWFGTAGLQVSSPCAGLSNADLGQKELTGSPLGAFRTYGFDVPADVRTKLAKNCSDFRFQVVLNVPTGVSGQYLLDNLRLATALPPNTTVGPTDITPILDFEEADAWTTIGGAAALSLEYHSHGNSSLSVTPSTHIELTNRPLIAIGPVTSPISFDFRPPAAPPPGVWRGQVQLFIDVPSKGIWHQWLGIYMIGDLTPTAFNTLKFNVPSSVLTILNAGGYSDLVFTITLDVSGGLGPYYVDNFQVGLASNPTPPPLSDVKHDIVGRASSGLVTLQVDSGSPVSPPVSNALFWIKSEDGNCVPTTVKTCRFVVELMQVLVGNFSIGGRSYTKALLENANAFRIVMGGANGMTPRIPSYATFQIHALGNPSTELEFNATSGSTFAVNPAGAGLITMAVAFQGFSNGHTFNVNGTITADSPLTNRPPVANAGPDQSLSSTSACHLTATLDASASTDPDGNLAHVDWYKNGRALLASGKVISVPIRRRGTYVFTAVAVDSWGSESRDDVTVNVVLPSSCP